MGAVSESIPPVSISLNHSPHQISRTLITYPFETLYLHFPCYEVFYTTVQGSKLGVPPAVKYAIPITCSGTGEITRVCLRTHWPTVRRTQANTPFIVFEHPDGTLVILCSYLIHPFSHFYLCKHPTPMLAFYPSGPLFKCHLQL